MVILRTNTLIVATLVVLSATMYSHSFAPNPCGDGYGTHLTRQQECYSENSLQLEQFQPSFPH